MARFTDSQATIISQNKEAQSEDDKSESLTSNSILRDDSSYDSQVSFMGATTQPIRDGTSISIDATIEKTNQHDLSYTHPQLGWCVNFVPPNGVMVQMTQLQELRDSSPTEAGELCMKCEHMIQIATVGELNEFRDVCSSIIAISSWKKPPPLWYVARMFRAAVCRGHFGLVQWMIEGGITPKTLPPVADSLHDIVSRFVLGPDKGEATLQVITYLVKEGNFDVSRPRKTDGWTPLHIAAQRNLLVPARHLISLGADVNAVGKDDIMPLNLADRIAKMLRPSTFKRIEYESEEEEEHTGGKDEEKAITSTKPSEEVDNKKYGDFPKDGDIPTEAEEAVETTNTPLQQLLIDKGAKRTWRRQPITKQCSRQTHLPSKKAAVRFSGGFTQQDLDKSIAANEKQLSGLSMKQDHQDNTGTVTQRADGGFTISCD